MSQLSEKKYCEDCEFYAGEIRIPRDYPTGRGHIWEYVCKIDNKSVYKRNINNTCKSYKEEEIIKIKKVFNLKKNKWWKIW